MPGARAAAAAAICVAVGATSAACIAIAAACSALLTASSDGVAGPAPRRRSSAHVALKSGRRERFQLALDRIDLGAGSGIECRGQRARLVERAVRGHGFPVQPGAERVQLRERRRRDPHARIEPARQSAASSSRRPTVSRTV